MSQYYIYILVAIMVIVMQFFGLKRFKKLKNRTKTLRAEATRLGLSYHYYNDNYERDYVLGFDYLDRSKGLANSSGGAYHMISGQYHNQTVLSFDYLFTATRTSAVTYSQTVFFFFDISPDIPDFIITPNNSLRQALKKSYTNASIQQQFEEQFIYQNNSNRSYSLSQGFLKKCMEYPELRIQKIDDRIVFFEKDYIIKPEHLQDNLDFYTQLIQQL
ncbi:hypothetical protein [Aquimarina rhabdastrellae]